MRNLTKRNKILLGIAGLVLVVVVAGLVLLGPSGAGLFGASDLHIIPSNPNWWVKGGGYYLQANTVTDCNWEAGDSNVIVLIDPTKFVKGVNVWASGVGTTTVKAHCGFLHLLTVSTIVTVNPQ